MPPLQISFLPAAVQAAIQDGILQRGFEGSLFPLLKWRLMADQERHAGGQGELVTKTRPGLIQPDTEATATIPVGGEPTFATRSLEQFSYQLKSLGKSLKSDLPPSFFAAGNLFMDDVEKLAQHAAQTMGRVARDRLIKAYGGGNTFATAGATSATVPVVSTNGFETVLVNGKYVAVSASNPLPALVGAQAVNVIAFDAVAKTLTLAASITFAQFDAVVSNDAPRVIRQANRATDRLIVAGDTATFAPFKSAKTWLTRHAVPGINGRPENDIHVCFITPDTKEQLFAITEFHDAIQAVGLTGPFASFAIGDYAGIRFVDNAEYTALSGGQLQTTIHESFMFGMGSLIEAYAPEDDMVGAAGAREVATMQHYKRAMDPQGVITYVARAPQDALGRALVHSWVANVDYCVPTDALSLAGPARFKRGVLIHTAGPA